MNRMGDGISKLDYLNPVPLRILCKRDVQCSHVACSKFQGNGKMQGISGTQIVAVYLGHFHCLHEGIAADRHNAYSSIGKRREFFAHTLCGSFADLPRANLD